MIIKFYEIKKKEISNINYFLLHGNNKGLLEETRDEIIKQRGNNNLYRYEENEIVKDVDKFEEGITNKSFFENEKIIIISRATDKILKTIENIVTKKLEDILIIITSNALEKKSKLRNFFEKEKKTICIAFYEDNYQSLNVLAKDFIREKKIIVSQENLNLIIERSRGDRINLKNELIKIDLFSQNNKKINSEDIFKLTNLSENFEAAELVDNALAQNKKKIQHILNENNFSLEDAIIILKIFLRKLKRLLEIQTQIEKGDNVDNVITNFKPPIFWKEKDIVKKQIKIWNLKKIRNFLIQVNETELLIKKYPSTSINVVTNLILEQAA